MGSAKAAYDSNAAGATAGGSWGKIIPFAEPDLPEIQTDLLPMWLGDMAAAVSQATQTPQAMAVMTGVATISTACQGKAVVSPTGTGYSEPLNTWPLIVMAPGNRKSAVINAMAEPLSDWQRDNAARLESKIVDNQTRREVYHGRIDKLKKDASKTGDEGKREILLAEIRQLIREMPEEIQARRLWASNITQEALQMALAGNQGRFALISDESTMFEIMAGLYSNGVPSLDVFLQGHAGTPCRIERVGRPAIHIDCPALTLCMCAQPSVLTELGQGSKKGFRGKGLLGRLLMVIPKSNIGTRDMRRFDAVPESVAAAYRAGVFALLDHPELQGSDGRITPRTIALSGVAFDLWTAFAQSLELRLAANGDLHDLADWGGKLAGACLRIAGLFHAVERGLDCTRIEPDTMRRAVGLCKALIPHARAAFGLISGGPSELSDAKFLHDWILHEQVREFTRSTILTDLKTRFKKADQVRASIDELTDRNMVRGPIQQKTAGRAREVYLVNPAIHSEGF
jgi:putative DNA primase/helicase